MLSPSLRRSLWIALLLAPALLLLSGLVVAPIASAFVYAFYRWQGLARLGPAGFENFRLILLQPPFSDLTWNAFWHNLVVFVALMVVQNGTAFFLAHALSKNLRLHRFHQVALFLPVILSTVIIGFLWKLFLNPIFGLVNQALTAVGLASWAQPWLGQASTALGALILVNAWHWVGFPTLVYLAAMQRIPRELLESAEIDGAGEWMRLARIVWPLVAPATTIVVILTFIGSFNWFELPYVMAGLEGPPYHSTDVLGLYFYRTAFGTVSAALQDFGRGSALAVLLFLFVLGISAWWVRLLRRREVEF
jgi:raffinose/stachyose/melibiose transport system permease protein